MATDGKLDVLMDRWMNEPGFKEKLVLDPEAAVQSSGLALDVQEWAALRSTMLAVADGELQARISKGWQN